MADIATQALLQVLFDKLSSYLIEEHGMLWLIGRDLKSLPLTLSKVQALLSFAQRHEIKDRNLATLLNKLEDAAYDADDVVDEFEYRIMRSRSKHGTEQDIESRCTCKGFWRSIFKCYDDRSKLRDCVRNLELIAADASGVMKMVESDHGMTKRQEMMKRRETSSLLTEQAFGRREVTEEVIGLLTVEPLFDGVNKNVTVLAIAGLVGVGKTTLAQLVFNHERVVRYFDVKMWINICDDFDVKMVIRELMAHFSDHSASAADNLSILHSNLRKGLSGKPFLLVVDGIWNVESSKWKTLLSILESAGTEGSMVLITIRNKKLADVMGAANTVILEGLSSAHYWPLFKKCAFGNKEPWDYPELEEIGRKIADKLDGSPLAARTLGRLLSCNLDFDHWRSVSKSQIMKLKQDDDDILPMLRSSYQQLPAHLKLCFAYCSLFIKRYKFDKLWLIQLWMAQGFIPTEEVGSEYFDELLSSFFFQHIEGNYYSIPYLIHKLAQDVSKDIDRCSEEDDYIPDKIPHTTRHLSFGRFGLKVADIKNLRRLKKLRTLMFFHYYNDPDFDLALHLLFTELKSIRVLSLSHSLMRELPVNIDNLRHLRHLDVSYSNIEKLPGSVRRLYNLQVLDLRGCKLNSFPKGICHLINLRHLEVDDGMTTKIPGIGKLVSLQKLEVFAVQKHRGYKIEELGEMTQLQGRLCIVNLENVSSMEEAQRAKLKNKKHINTLQLEWASYERNAAIGRDRFDDRVLEGLEPPPNLRELNITCYAGVATPNWMKDERFLMDLKSLHLIRCRRLRILPLLGKLPSLRVLRLSTMDEVSLIDSEFYGCDENEAFPRLEKLEIEDMPELKEWVSLSAPRLTVLTIRDCPNLEKMPSLPPTVTRVKIVRVGLISLPGFLLADVEQPSTSKKASSVRLLLSSLEIRDCLKLMSLEVGLLQYNLTVLKDLIISNCAVLTSLPGEVFGGFVFLQNLTIEHCPVLASMGQEFRLPLSLSTLKVSGCSNLRSLPCAGMRSLKTLKINGCENLHALDDLESLHSLKNLEVNDCSNLTLAGEENLPSLEELCTDNILILLQLCQQGGLSHLSVLKIQNIHSLESIPNELEGWFASHTSLQELDINLCTKLQQLPSKFPSSLRRLDIFGCPMLEELCKKDSGLYWDKISHIPFIRIGLAVLQDNITGIEENWGTLPAASDFISQ